MEKLDKAAINFQNTICQIEIETTVWAKKSSVQFKNINFKFLKCTYSLDILLAGIFIGKRMKRYT